jgi:hypothetical protein
MNHSGKLCATIWLAVSLGACATTHYQNTIHPNYGDAEYKTDETQCRKENSKTETQQGYDVMIHVTVDEAKAASCMQARGWQASK